MRVRHIADDYQRSALVRVAVQRAVELADEDFYHAQTVHGMADADLDMFAQHGLGMFSAIAEFDYQQFARDLYLRAYKAAYRAHLRDLVDGIRRAAGELVDAIERETRLSTPDA
ncbi:MAG TPA: hypothetical protein VGN32_20930 [Ktedonobacterales bacterium]|jgi:hypothetical protein|nr:hypothetical protein [Ktedonobacterales bacterium]